MPLAVAEAKQGNNADAVVIADSAIEAFKGFSKTGLSLGLAYETRARVALLMNDRETFLSYAILCAEQYKVGHNPALTAKYEKLMQEARQAKVGIPGELAEAAGLSALSGDTVLRLITNLFDECKGPQARAERALELLVKQSNCLGGYLYTIQNDGPSLSAQLGDSAPFAGLDALVQECLSAEIEGTNDMTMASAASEIVSSVTERTDWSGQQGENYHPVVIGHRTPKGFAVAGLAVLLVDPSKTYIFPGKIVAAISKSLVDAGDITAAYSAA
jgi:hypothetical protein